MALNPSNSSNLEQLALKGLISQLQDRALYFKTFANKHQLRRIHSGKHHSDWQISTLWSPVLSLHA